MKTCPECKSTNLLEHNERYTCLDCTWSTVPEIPLQQALEFAQGHILECREYLNDKGAFNLAGELSAVDIILSELIRLIVTREITKFYCDKKGD